MDSDILHLLVVPLLGGYVFCARCHLTAFSTRRADGQRLIYHSSVAGIFLLIAARTLEKVLQAAVANPEPTGAVISWLTQISACITVSAGIALLLFGQITAYGERERGLSTASGAALMISGLLTVWFTNSFSIWWTLFGTLGVVIVFLLIALLCAAVIRGASYATDMHIVVRVSLLVPTVFLGITFLLLYGPRLTALWPQFSSIKYSGLALAAAGLGATLWLPTNVVLTNRWAWRRAHESGRTSGLERLLYRAFRARLPIQVTLKDGKVYSGFLLEMLPPVARLEGSCIEFLPTSSGYRDPTTKTVTITTDYAQVIEKLATPQAPPEGGPPAPTLTGDRLIALRAHLSSLLKSIPLSEIQVASMYDTSYSVKDFSIPSADLAPAG
jgi:hypothetical protein